MIAIHNGVALYKGTLTLTDQGLFGHGFVDRKLNRSNCILVNKPSPSPWIGRGWLWDGEEFTMTDWWRYEYINSKIASKANEIDSDFESEISILKAGYTDDEMKSWDKQDQEARAYLLDNTSTTPLLSSMIGERGGDIHDFSIKIVKNSDSWSVAYGAALGRKQKRQKELENIDVDSIDVISIIDGV